MPPLRIAVLECDTPLEGTRTKYGSYGGVFSALLAAGAALVEQETGAAPELAVTKWDVVNADAYPRLEDVDAILLSGSKHNSFDSAPWILRLVDFVRGVLAEQSRVKVIGVCFGHQIVGRALDVKVDRSEQGWEVAVTPMQLTARGKQLFGIDRDLSLHQMHRDIVYFYPEGVEQLGSSPRCATQGMYVKNKLITVQGHPEFTGEIVTEILNMRKDAGIFPEGVYEDGMRRVADKHDGAIVAKAFLKFVMEG